MVKYLFLLFAFSALSAWSQEAAPTKYWVHFSDKANSSYSVNNPEAFLSAKSIARRTQAGIAIEENDLPVNAAYISEVLASGNITVLNVSKWFNSISIETTDTLALDTLYNKSFIVAVNKMGKMARTSDINKFEEVPSANKTQDSEGIYGIAEWNSYMLKLEYLHIAGYTGEGMTIAVFDAGFSGVDVISAFDYMHEQGHVKGMYDFVDQDSDVYGDHTHGTSVLSTIAALDTGTFIGTAPDADFWLFRTEDGASETLMEEDNWVAAAEYADSVGVDIINSSLGYTTFDNSSDNHSYADMTGDITRITRGADIAASKGILVVNSAGNSGSSSWTYIGAPADGDSVLAIGAVDANMNYASFSSKGPSYDGDIKPNVTAFGKNCAVINGSGSATYSSGTSFSSPILAGAAACLWQSNKERTNMEIFAAIQESAHMYDAPDSLYGHGIPNFEIAYELIKKPEPIPDPVPPVSVDSLVIFPVPVTDQLTVGYYAKADETLQVRIIDAGGRVVVNESHQMIHGYNEFSYRAWNSGSGAYTLFLGDKFTRKFVVIDPSNQ